MLWLEEWWKNIKMLPGTQKMNSIIPTKEGKFKAAEVSTGTLKEYTLSANAQASQSSQNVNVSFSLQGYPTQPSFPVPVQYQVGQWVIVKDEGKLFPGELTMVIPDQVKVNAIICHATNLWKWPRKEGHIFYFNHDVDKGIVVKEYFLR